VGVSRGIGALIGTAASLLVLAGAAGAVGEVTWIAPTPPEGARFNVAAGTSVGFTLAAKHSAGSLARIHIGTPALPPGASFQSTDGNPASATFAWTPTAAQAGSYALTFTASANVPGIGSATRVVYLQVNSPPPPPPKKEQRRRKRFVLSGVNHTWRWAGNRRPVVARAAPSSSAPRVARIPLYTPEHTLNLVQLLDGVRTRSGTWIRVRLAILPNGATGWVPRKALGAFHPVTARFIVDRKRLRATLERRGKIIFGAPIAIGGRKSPTPPGDFYVRNMLFGFHNESYGPVAFGTSARSAKLTDWPGGGYIGIHGTDKPRLIPGHVSHGCIRLRNRDMLRLARLLPIGAPVTVR
jgi:hypothetical protein